MAVTALGLAVQAPAHAQFDPAIFAKWGSTPVLKFNVVETYAAERYVLNGGDARADVTDRYELEFRWNQFESKLVGEPTFTNYPSEVSNVRGSTPGCPPPTLSGDFEHGSVVSMAQSEGLLVVTLRTDYPAGAVSQMCSDSMRAVAASSEEQPVMLMTPAIALLGMKTGQMPGLTVEGDTLTMTHDEGTTSWTISKG